MSFLHGFLSGIRVVDLSRHLPGPLATLLLADMGAEVLKIEPPSGDELRTMGPPTSHGASAYFEAVNAGKMTRRLNLKRDDDRNEFYNLVRGVDVVVESFRPGVMSRLGADYERLQTLNPRLIYCSISGYGAGSPLEATAGHDINYLARAGAVTGVTATSDGIPVTDDAGALFAAIAILGALHGRARDGRGCRIDLALADVVMPMQLFQLAALGVTGRSPVPDTGLLNGGAACYRVYTTADGKHVSLGAIEPKFWRAFCEAAERSDWIARQGDALPQRALIDEVSALFGRLTLAECESRFGPADCCYAAVLDLADAVQSPHVLARGLVRRGASGLLEALFPAIVDGERPSSRPALREDAPAGSTETSVETGKCV
jgi:crotonobetainyl-CoA:carnitine CoA-transferase CaiB-like acyl-CoA transferase